MKKKRNKLCCFVSNGMPKILRKMKLVSFLMLISVVSVTANSYSQQTKFNMNFENITVRQVFQHIEENSEFILLYSEESVDVNRRVDVTVNDENINSVLDQVFEGTHNRYEIHDRQIAILLKEKSELPSIFDPVQKKNVTGQVNDASGQALPGVSIVIKGTTVGTITDFNGNFNLSDVPEDAILVFSFVGMKALEVPVAGKSSLNILMEEDAIGIEEVVAIGYGTMKKKDLTGSVASVRSEDLERGSPVDVLTGIQGKMAGVRISTSSGDPGAGVDISIRGKNSISAGTSPLFIIDGMPYDYNPGEIASSSIGENNSSNPLSLINPNDIKTVTVLKDASATSIYGSRGANGVIIIETKSGGTAKTVINFGASLGLSETNRKIPVLSGNEFIEYRRDVDPHGFLFYSLGDLNKPVNPYALEQHDWQDEILRTGFLQNYDFSLSGKTKETNYSASFGYLDNEAIIKNTLQLKMDNQKNENLLIGLQTRTTYAEINGATQSGGGSDLFNGIVQNLVISTPLEFYNPTYDPGDVYISPSSMIDEAYKKTSTMSLNANAYMHYTLNNDLKLILSIGSTLSSSKGSEYYGKETNWGFGDNGYSYLTESRVKAVSGSAQLHFKKIYQQQHDLTAMVATESNIYDYEWFAVNQTNFLIESTGVFDIQKGSVTKRVGSYKDTNRRVSFFGRLNYIFREKHIATLNFRADGSDKFGKKNSYGYFPSAAYSWVLINEDFMKKQSLFSNAKIRLSYGVSGNDRIPSYRYLARLESTYYDGELGMAPSSQANDKLKWETTYQTNIGIDLGFLKNRLTLTTDLYDKQTRDMLIPIPTPGRTGYSEQWQNVGIVDNKGFEIQLSSVNIDRNNFKWSTDFNVSHNKNKVVDLGLTQFIPVSIGGAWIGNVGRVSVGRSIGEAYGYEFDGIYQINDFTWQNNSDPTIDHHERNYELKENRVSVAGVNVKPGSHKFKDLDGDGVINLDDDRKAISSSEPLFFGGLSNTFQYKNFDLNIFVEGAYGNEVFNESRYRLEGTVLTYMNVTKDFYYNHWTSDNPSNELGDYADRNTTALLTSSYYVEDASFIRFKSVTLGYNFENSLLRFLSLKSARLYVTGNNLLTLTRYSGYDPEVNSEHPLMRGFDRISYPRSRSVLVGINVSF